MVARPVSAAICSGLGRFPGDLPSFLTNGVDHTLTMALSRTLVRLRNEMASIVPHQMGHQDADRLYHLITTETLRRILTEEYGLVVAETNTALAALALRSPGSPASRGPFSCDTSASAVSFRSPVRVGL